MKTTLKIVKNINLIICELYIATLITFNIAYGWHWKPITFEEKQASSIIYILLVVGVLLELILQSRVMKENEKVNLTALKILVDSNMFLCTERDKAKSERDGAIKERDDLKMQLGQVDILLQNKIKDKPKTEEATKRVLSEEEKQFIRKVFTEENCRKYDTDMLGNFYDFWSAPFIDNKGNRTTKMLWQTKPHFFIDKRLAHWHASRTKTKANDNENISK